MPDGGKNALLWQPEKEKPWGKIAGAVVAGLVVVGGAVVFLTGGEDTTPKPEASVATQPKAPPSTPAPSPKPSPATPAKADPPKPAPTEPAPAPKPKESVDQCVGKHFAPDAFGEEIPKFAFVCDQTDPRRTAMNLKARLVYAQQKGGPVSEAMKEWSILNWYELAFASTVAHACCETTPALDPQSEVCEFSDKIVAIGKAGATGKGIEEAIKAFDKGIQCLINFQVAAHYKQKHPTYGPERDAFKRISARSLK